MCCLRLYLAKEAIALFATRNMCNLARMKLPDLVSSIQHPHAISISYIFIFPPIWCMNRAPFRMIHTRVRTLLPAVLNINHAIYATAAYNAIARDILAFFSFQTSHISFRVRV